jgi:hypothetical protein
MNTRIPLFAGTGTGIYKSTDGGTSWSIAWDISSGVRKLAIDPEDPDILYAVEYSGYVLKSTNGGNRGRPTRSPVFCAQKPGERVGRPRFTRAVKLVLPAIACQRP